VSCKTALMKQAPRVRISHGSLHTAHTRPLPRRPTQDYDGMGGTLDPNDLIGDGTGLVGCCSLKALTKPVSKLKGACCARMKLKHIKLEEAEEEEKEEADEEEGEEEDLEEADEEEVEEDL